MMCARIKATSRRDDQAMLQFASQDYVFQTFLVAWTDEAGANYEQARGAGRFTFSVLASLRWRQHGSWEIRERDYMKSIHILEQGLAITEPYAPFDGAKSPEEVGFVFDAPVTPLHWKWLLEDKY
jgi:hypothetical protein